ncbi:aminoacetone oxidase family FAD-binding enzyme [bacterium]|nr:aminoacetone oxidase family FAD-binding enzyme [bacterium]
MEQCCQDNKIKIAVVGAGPAGIYCALNILEEFKNNNFSNYFVSIFDKSQALRTILPTGGTRCNITNAIPDIKEFASNYPRGEKFLYSLFSRHFNTDTITFFDSINVKTYIQDDGRVFPVSNSAKDVKDKMLSKLNEYKNFKLVHKKISSKDELSGYDKVIIATGSRDTLDLLQSYNQPLVPFKKSLCALKVKDFKYPQGVSVKSLDGDFVFTSEGISGPLAFRISALNINTAFPYDICIKLFEPCDLIQLAKENPKKSIGNLVSKFIPKSLAHIIVEKFDKNAAEISAEKIKSYSELKLSVIASSNQGEIVHSGGVSLKFIDKNCKSKINDNLWFCGEVLDIDGFCGGFNLQNCWSSAYVVAKDVVSSIINK